MSSEIGAVPQPSDNDIASDFPSSQICQEVSDSFKAIQHILLDHKICESLTLQEGISKTECSQECLFGCKSPLCSMGCLCACDTSQQRSELVAILSQEQKEIKLLAVQHDMWKAGQTSLARKGLASSSVQEESPPVVQSPRWFKGSRFSRLRYRTANPSLAAPVSQVEDNKRTDFRSHEQEEVHAKSKQSAFSMQSEPSIHEAQRNPRFQRHQKIDQKKKVLKALAFNAFMRQAAVKARAQLQERTDEAMTDVGGFDWNRMSQQPAMKQDPAMVALGRESDKIDDVYDPSEDPQNIGPGDSKKDVKPEDWWNEDALNGAKLDDQWWQHGGEDGMTG